MNRVLFLTGTCGSGKSTVASLLARAPDWGRLSEDDLWHARFGRDRGAFGSDAHRRKRRAIQADALRRIAAILATGKSAVVDATLHESPPEAFLEYRARLEALGFPWSVRILRPRLEVAIARDASRDGWHVGAERVAGLHAKFSGAIFPAEWFLDTSDDSPETTARRVLESGA